MRTLLMIILIAFFTFENYAQSPQSFQYQAVVRDASGTALVNQSVNFQISIISGSVSGTIEYVETHAGSTNEFGIVTLQVGAGTATLGSFSSIDWGITSYFIKVEADPSGGTSYLDMGTTQLLSVPYALYAEKAGNIPLYTGGVGIDVIGTTITNLSPDQLVNITSGTGVSVNGTYPNFTIDNTAPDQQVTLTGIGATTVSGTYPDFIISSTDTNTTYSAGAGIDVTGTTITNTAPDQPITLTQGGATSISGTYPNFTISSTDLNTGTPGGTNKQIQFNNTGSFGGDAALIWDNSNKRLGIGSATPSGRVVIQGSSTASPAEPLFEIKNSAGQQIMAVYNDSIHFFITDIGANKGGFAVSGRNSAKALTNDFLRLNADSTRIYTGNSTKGFGVRNINGAIKESYMHITPSNSFIGHQSGSSITTGLYNVFTGYQTGQFLTTGSYNVFNGYRAGQYDTIADYNVFIGYMAGWLNSSGDGNSGVGFQALKSNTSGFRNSALGYNALVSNTTGYNNISIGFQSLLYNNVGFRNTAVGYHAIVWNTSGTNNSALGNGALYSNATGTYNSALGDGAFLGGAAYTNSTAIGSGAPINTNNKIRLGDATVMIIEGQMPYTFPSDERFKFNVTEEVKGLDFILKLRPIVYNFDTKKFDDFLYKDIPDSVKREFLRKKDYSESTSLRQTGFIAQEIEQAAKESGFDFNGVHKPSNENDNYSVAYSLFTVPLVKAVQELNAKNESLIKIIEDQQKQIDELRSLINK